MHSALKGKPGREYNKGAPSPTKGGRRTPTPSRRVAEVFQGGFDFFLIFKKFLFSKKKYVIKKIDEVFLEIE